MMTDPKKPSATVLSILPFDITERKVGVFPPEYLIPGAKKLGDVGSLIVQGVFTFVYIDMDRGSQRRDYMPMTVAESIVQDYVSAQVYQTPDAKPGLMAVDGFYNDMKTIKTVFDRELTNLAAMQTRWFKLIYERGNDEWIRSGKQARSLNELHKAAADYLGLTPEWMNVSNADVMIKCPACRTSVSTEAAICFSCKTVLNPQLAAQFVQSGQVPIQHNQSPVTK